MVRSSFRNPARTPPGAASPRVLITCALLAAAWAVPALLTGPLPKPVGREFAGIESLLKAGDYREALAQAKTQTRRFPRDPVGRALLGLAFLRSGEIGPAERALRSALQIDAGCPEAHLGLGRIARGRNRPAEALAHFRMASSGGGFGGEAWDEIRRLQADRGDFRAARAAAERAAERPGGMGGMTAAALQASLEHNSLCGPGPHLRIPDSFTRATVPLLRPPPERRRRIQEIEVRVNGEGPFVFDLDSAYRGVMIVSPELADRLSLRRAGRSGGAGVGPERKVLEGAHLDRIEIGDLTIESLPVQVMASPTFDGEERGLIGTGLLKRFNLTIDAKAGTLDLFRGDRPDLLEEGIEESRVLVRIPIFVSGPPLVPVGVNAAAERHFMIDTAASVTLLDERFFRERIEPETDPQESSETQIRGSGGAQEALMLPSASILLGGMNLGESRIVVFDMDRINAIGGVYVAGILGADRLWEYRVHFNFAGPELVLERYGEGA